MTCPLARLSEAVWLGASRDRGDPMSGRALEVSEPPCRSWQQRCGGMKRTGAPCLYPYA
jgi:hypothetical protein